MAKSIQETDLHDAIWAILCCSNLRTTLAMPCKLRPVEMACGRIEGSDSYNGLRLDSFANQFVPVGSFWTQVAVGSGPTTMLSVNAFTYQEGCISAPQSCSLKCPYARSNAGSGQITSNSGSFPLRSAALIVSANPRTSSTATTEFRL